MLTHICRVKKSREGWNLQEDGITLTSFSLEYFEDADQCYLLQFLSSSFIFEIRRQQSIETKPNKTQCIFCQVGDKHVSMKYRPWHICFISGMQVGKGYFIYRENRTWVMHFCLQGQKQYQKNIGAPSSSWLILFTLFRASSLTSSERKKLSMSKT